MANALFSGALQGLTGMPDPLAPSNVPAPKPAPAAQPTARSAFQESQAAQEQLAKATAEQAQFEGLQAANLAERQARQQERGTEALGRYRETIEAPEIREERTRAEEAASKPFVPTADNVQDLATMFSLISVLGFAIGAGGKTNAIQAMNAMNGMMEGYQQGREDFYLREKDAFEQNAKALKTKIDSLNNKMKEVAQMAAIDLDKANQEADMLFAKEGADFLKQYKDKVGLVATIKMLQEKAKSSEKLAEFLQKEESRAAEKERDRQFQLQRMREHDQNMQLMKTIAAQGGSKNMQQFAIAQRAVTALQGAASTIESVMKLPAGATAGILPNLQTKDGMFNFVRNAAGRKLSAQESKAIETLYSGMSRYLATIEASGTAVGLVGLAQQLEKLQPRAGDTVGDIALKIADVRRISTEAVSAMVNSGLLPPKAAEAAEIQIKRMEKAVPFTTNDVVEAMYAGKKTLGEATTGVVEKGAKETFADAEKEKRYQKWLKENPQ